MNREKMNHGFMKIVIIAVVAIATLAYFNIDLRVIFENPIIQKISHIFVVAWVSYLKPLLAYFYTSIFGLFN